MEGALLGGRASPFETFGVRAAVGNGLAQEVSVGLTSPTVSAQSVVPFSKKRLGTNCPNPTTLAPDSWLSEPLLWRFYPVGSIRCPFSGCLSCANVEEDPCFSAS